MILRSFPLMIQHTLFFKLALQLARLFTLQIYCQIPILVQNAKLN
jgi:hypothetical protein